MMGIALLMLLGIYLVLKRTRIGLVIQAALTHPDSVEALGHNVPLVRMLVFGAGAGLAGLAGVIGGNAFVTEPSMASAVGNIIFVIVVTGGLGSLLGALLASLLMGLLQTGAVSMDQTLATLLGRQANPASPWYDLMQFSVAGVAPILPYLFLVLILIVRPRGLLGTRET